MRSCEEKTFATDDGVALFYRRWPALTERKGAILMFHRGHEHSVRMAHLVDELDMPAYDFFAWDARGHGRSPGARGHSPSFGTSVRDIENFVRHISATYQIAACDMALIAQSVGAVLAAAYVHDYAPKIRAMVLAAPAFKVKLYIPFARPALKVMHRLRGDFFVQSYVKARFLTHDQKRIRSFEEDPLITRAISVNILLGLYETSARIVSDARAITTPTQLLISGADFVVHQGPQHRFYERLGSHVKERHVLHGFYHDTLGEAGRDDAIAHARRFLTAAFETDLPRPSLRDADRHGQTRDEADRLETPLSLFSPKGAWWALQRLQMKIAGLFSEGIRLGHATGFDSGASLDYVYRNAPSGVGSLGRFVDRIYLNAIGWRGIRQRKIHVEDLIRSASRRLAAEGKPIHIVDIAAGHGRYVLDAIQDLDVKPHSVLLRDQGESNVAACRAAIQEREIAGFARAEKGDAFDAAALAALEPRPTLALVSGLYELFADNDLVRGSLQGLAAAIPAGGYLIYTGQPWHPQLELIARTLTSHREGRAWVMRRRVQVELDEIVERAGFEKIAQRIDAWGIFTVSLARRTA